MATIHCIKCNLEEIFINFKKNNKLCPKCNKKRIVINICNKCNIIFVVNKENQILCKPNC